MYITELLMMVGIVLIPAGNSLRNRVGYSLELFLWRCGAEPFFHWLPSLMAQAPLTPWGINFPELLSYSQAEQLSQVWKDSQFGRQRTALACEVECWQLACKSHSATLKLSGLRGHGVSNIGAARLKLMWSEKRNPQELMHNVLHLCKVQKYITVYNAWVRMQLCILWTYNYGYSGSKIGGKGFITIGGQSAGLAESMSNCSWR